MFRKKITDKDNWLEDLANNTPHSGQFNFLEKQKGGKHGVDKKKNKKATKKIYRLDF